MSKSFREGANANVRPKIPAGLAFGIWQMSPIGDILKFFDNLMAFNQPVCIATVHPPTLLTIFLEGLVLLDVRGNARAKFFHRLKRSNL
jgi:hypothetical protein